jgi:hypothetical protein
MLDLGIDKLGPWPLLQLAGAFMVLIGLALAVYRGTRDRKSAAPQDQLITSIFNHIERSMNDRFDRVDRSQADAENEMRDGFRRLEHALTDQGKDILALRQRRGR